MCNACKEGRHDDCPCYWLDGDEADGDEALWFGEGEAEVVCECPCVRSTVRV